MWENTICRRKFADKLGISNNRIMQIEFAALYSLTQNKVLLYGEHPFPFKRLGKLSARCNYDLKEIDRYLDKVVHVKMKTENKRLKYDSFRFKSEITYNESLDIFSSIHEAYKFLHESTLDFPKSKMGFYIWWKTGGKKDIK